MMIQFFNVITSTLKRCVLRVSQGFFNLNFQGCYPLKDFFLFNNSDSKCFDLVENLDWALNFNFRDVNTVLNCQAQVQVQVGLRSAKGQEGQEGQIWT